MGYHKCDPFLDDSSAYLKSHTEGKRSDEVYMYVCTRVLLYFYIAIVYCVLRTTCTYM